MTKHCKKFESLEDAKLAKIITPAITKITDSGKSRLFINVTENWDTELCVFGNNIDDAYIDIKKSDIYECFWFGSNDAKNKTQSTNISGLSVGTRNVTAGNVKIDDKTFEYTQCAELSTSGSITINVPLGYKCIPYVVCCSSTSNGRTMNLYKDGAIIETFKSAASSSVCEPIELKERESGTYILKSYGGTARIALIILKLIAL